MFKSEGIGGSIDRRQVNAGEGRGRDWEIDTQQVNIDKVWQKVRKGVERLPSLVGSVFLRPSKSIESSSKRGEDRDENVEGYAVDVDAPI